MTAQQTTRPVRVIGYIRVSTNFQKEQATSPDVQKTKILEKAREMGTEPLEIYNDNGRSGTNMNRPELTAMLARCSQKDITHLIVYDTSRISRNTGDYLTIRTLLAKYKVEVIALTGMSSNGDDPYSKFFDEILASVNALQPRIAGYKARLTCVAKFQAGYYPSFAALGYSNIENPHSEGIYDKRIIVPNPKVAPFIVEAFKMYASGGHTIYSITEYLKSHGVLGKFKKQLQHSVVYGLLRQSFYWGWMRWGGMEQMGRHIPLIDETTFKIVQQLLRERGQFGIRNRKHNFLLRSLLFCKNCERRFTAEYHKINSKAFPLYGTYHCSGWGIRNTNCKSASIEMEELESQARSEIAKLKFKPEFVESVKHNVMKIYKETVKTANDIKKAISNRKSAIEARQNRIQQDYVDNKLSIDEYHKMSKMIEAEMLSIEKELLEADKVKTFDVHLINDVLAITRDIIKNYDKADIDRKRIYLKFFVRKFIIHDKKIVEVEYQPAIKALVDTNLVILTASWGG